MLTWSLFIIKPDAVRRNKVGEILCCLESEDFEIRKLKMVDEADRCDVLRHYAEHRRKEFFGPLTRTLIGQRIVIGAACYRTIPEDSVARLRAVVGPYKDPGPATIRGVFAVSEMENSMHSSDSDDAAMTETLIWFPEG